MAWISGLLDPLGRCPGVESIKASRSFSGRGRTWEFSRILKFDGRQLRAGDRRQAWLSAHARHGLRCHPDKAIRLAVTSAETSDNMCRHSLRSSSSRQPLIISDDVQKQIQHYARSNDASHNYASDSSAFGRGCLDPSLGSCQAPDGTCMQE